MYRSMPRSCWKSTEPNTNRSTPGARASSRAAARPRADSTIGNSAASSARLYWESYQGAFTAVPLSLPAGCSVFAKEIYRAPRSWAEACMSQLIHWNELDRGGHFAAFEQPALFVGELRTCFRTLRG